MRKGRFNTDIRTINPYKDARAHRNASGFFVLDRGTGKGWEVVADTLQCPHCNQHFIFTLNVSGHCFKCGKDICGSEHCMAKDCMPFEKKLELYEAGKLSVLR